MTNGIGSICSKALRNAKQQDRLIVGLSQAIKTLSNDPEDTMFCILAQPKPGDSAAHMQVILLEAFCYENGIYTINVDDTEKLSTIVGAPKLENCVLMQRFKHQTDINNNQPLKLMFFDLEEKLTDHCEDYWDSQHKPIIRLPDEWTIKFNEVTNSNRIQLVNKVFSQNGLCAMRQWMHKPQMICEVFVCQSGTNVWILPKQGQQANKQKTFNYIDSEWYWFQTDRSRNNTRWEHGETIYRLSIQNICENDR